MRFLKITAIIMIACVVMLMIIYGGRLLVANNVLKSQLSRYPLEVKCLDISFTRSMNLVVDKLCLQTPKANIDIVNMTIKWQLLSDLNMTHIEIERVNITGTDHLFSNIEQTKKINHKSDKTIRQLLSSILRPHIKQIKQLNVPIELTVAQVHYLPFMVKSQQQSSLNSQFINTYVASLSAIDNTLSFSLKNSAQDEFINVELIKVKEQGLAGFSISLSSNLALLKTFADLHQLPITAELQKFIRESTVAGYVETQIASKSDLIRMNSDITDLVLTSQTSTEQYSPLQLSGDISVENKFHLMEGNKNKRNNSKKDKLNLKKSEILFTFIGENTLTISYEHQRILDALVENKLPPAAISIFKANPMSQLTITLKDNDTLKVTNDTVMLSGIQVSGNSDQNKHYAEVTNLLFYYNKSNHQHREALAKQAGEILSIGNFIIDSKLNFSDLIKLTSDPIDIHLEGSLLKKAKQTALSLQQNSYFTVKNITLAKKQDSLKANKTSLFKLQALKTQLAGDLLLNTNNDITVNLTAESEASQFTLPKVILINSLKLANRIKGNFDDIEIHSEVNADGVKLGNIDILGSALSPKIKIAGKELQLTDLLTLNIQLPTKVSLIDGMLDYSISGKVTDLYNLEQSPFNASVTLTSVSGEIEDIWLQELNWQQRFTFLAGRLTTLPNDAENLTIELIETPTPMTKLSVNTSWSFNKSFSFSANDLKAGVLGGSFSIPKIAWPLEHGHSANVQLNSIDLEQVLALDKKQGIVVTGEVSGQIPITFDGDKYIIENGELYNISNGLIQVMDSPAVAELKANNTQLQLAFDALQNLHYHQLSSVVSMEDDGYMLLETVIKGRNPDIDNDVNLNLNLNYDLLGLLESLFVTQRFEENIIKGLQKDKE